MSLSTGACQRDGANHAGGAPPSPTLNHAPLPKEGGAAGAATVPRPEVTPPPVVRRDGPVSVDPEPACGVESPPKAKTQPVRTETWFTAPATQPQRRDAVEREIENWKSSVAGTYLDDNRRAFVIVLHSDFAHYDGLRQKLEPISPPLKVVLRPACYSRQRIDEARSLLQERSWHPQAASARFAMHFDARFSAFAVGFENTAPEVAEALEQRLGQLVRVNRGTTAPPPPLPPGRQR
jgi:hypothetical protein